MPPMPGRRGKGRLSLYPEDDKGKEEIQGDTAGVGELPRVREGIDEGVTGCAPPNPARRGKGGTGTGGQLRRRGK